MFFAKIFTLNVSKFVIFIFPAEKNTFFYLSLNTQKCINLKLPN